MSGQGGEVPRVGIDIGGTFTDFVLVRPGEGPRSLRTLKRFSTPDDPARAVLEGLEELRVGEADPDVVHGSTVATNALLERRGARTSFVATRGFGDLLRLARQDRPELYDLFADRPEPLVPPELTFEVDERVGPGGEILRSLASGEAGRVAERVEASGARSVAVCLLFAYEHPEHEERVAAALRETGVRVSVSHEVLPEFREYERASTTAVDAYVGPVVDSYLGRLEASLPARRFRVMQSNGGSVGVGTARRRAVGSLLSGPAAGVAGGLAAARAAGHDGAITLDMGGTSTDVALARGELPLTREATVDGLPVAVPMVDLHTVGSGGGSVAWLDPGGSLRVGPRSAGAQPGPACYGRGGDRPTVTDADLALGRMDPERFLGGEVVLDGEAARGVLDRLGREAGLGDDDMEPWRAAALGVVRVANARMERALRVITVERGHDPAGVPLVCFGGAGALHACELARSLGIREVLVPRGAATLSAFGMLATDVVREASRTVMMIGEPRPEAIARRLRPLEEAVREAVGEEGIPEARIQVRREAAMRYRGQSYEITVPFDERVLERFHRRHRERYGHAEPGAPVEVVTLRAVGVGRVDAPALPEEEPGPADPSAARAGETRATVEREGRPSVEPSPLYDGARLRAGHRIGGPAVVARRYTTLWLPPGCRARVDRRRDLRIEVDA